NIKSKSNLLQTYVLSGHWIFFGGKNPSLNKPFSFQEVERAIRNSRNSTPGADGIPANWFKKLNYSDIFKITSIFQDIFSTSCIPSQWQHSLIVPIPKPNKDKTKLNSYRPIALIPVFSKIFEKIIGNCIIQHLTINKKISPHLNCFLPLRDNQLVVYKIHTAIIEAQHKKDFFIGISLDIKNAYDSVYIDGLMLKWTGNNNRSSQETPQISSTIFSKTELFRYVGGTLCPAQKMSRKGFPKVVYSL
ncbi:hypothetical protein AVEN_63345-1, partial [Araneus ventricosus]